VLVISDLHLRGRDGFGICSPDGQGKLAAFVAWLAHRTAARPEIHLVISGDILALLLAALTAAGCGKGLCVGEVPIAVADAAVDARDALDDSAKDRVPDTVEDLGPDLVPTADAPVGALLTLGFAPDSSTDFGSVILGSLRVQSFLVVNVGQVTSSALALAVTGVGFLLGPPAPGDCGRGSTVLAGGAHCTISVIFRPPANGPATASLTVSADVGGAPPALELTGSAHTRGQVQEFLVPPMGGDSGPMGITAGPDGKLWFTETGTASYGVGNATTAGVVSMMPTRLSLSAGGWGRPAFGIVPWSDGSLWLKEENSFVLFGVAPSGTAFGNNIGIVATADITSALTRTITGLTGVAIGADKNLWFADLDTDTVACFKFNIFRSLASCLSSPIPIASGSEPFGITAGPDGSMWFTEVKGNRIGRVTQAGLLTELDIPTAASGPTGIAVGPDGNLWFTEQAANRIGRLSPPVGPFAEFVVPTVASGPFWITAGPDGALWFTEREADRIGRITTSGEIEEFPTHTNPSGPAGIVTGPDGNLWFTESTANQIGQITP